MTLEQPTDRVGHDADTNYLSGTVEVAVFQGASIRCKVRTDSGLPLDAICAPPAVGTFAPGARVSISIDSDRVKVLPNEAPVSDIPQAVAA